MALRTVDLRASCPWEAAGAAQVVAEPGNRDQVLERATKSQLLGEAPDICWPRRQADRRHSNQPRVSKEVVFVSVEKATLGTANRLTARAS